MTEPFKSVDKNELLRACFEWLNHWASLGDQERMQLYQTLYRTSVDLRVAIDIALGINAAPQAARAVVEPNESPSRGPAVAAPSTPSATATKRSYEEQIHFMNRQAQMLAEEGNDVSAGVMMEAIAMLATLRGEVEQRDVQLAGVSTAALGWNQEPARKGDYGWSVPYQDTLELRFKYDRLRKEHPGELPDRALSVASHVATRAEQQLRETSMFLQSVASAGGPLSGNAMEQARRCIVEADLCRANPPTERKLDPFRNELVAWLRDREQMYLSSGNDKESYHYRDAANIIERLEAEQANNSMNVLVDPDEYDRLKALDNPSAMERKS